MRKSAAYAVFITGACPEIASGGATPRRQMNAAASSETADSGPTRKKILEKGGLLAAPMRPKDAPKDAPSRARRRRTGPRSSALRRT